MPREGSRAGSCPTWRERVSDYTLALANYVLVNFGLSMADPATILPVLLRELKASNTIIGLLPSIRFGGWLLPQLFVAGYLQSKSRKKRFVALLGLFRGIVYLLIGLILVSYTRLQPGFVVVLFLLLFAVTRVSAGSASVGRLDVIAKTIPRERLTSFFAARGFWAGLTAFLAGLIVSAVLGSGLAFPVNYAVLFFLGGSIFAVAALAMSCLRERPSREKGSVSSPREQLAWVPHVLRSDRQYCNYLAYRAFLRAAAIADAFYVVYATTTWGIPAAVSGTFLSASTAARLLATLLWRRVAERQGVKRLLRYVLLAGLVPPLIASSLSLWLPRVAGHSGTLTAIAAFVAIYLAQGMASAGHQICSMAILLTIAPESERPNYIGFTNTATGLLSFLPIAAGWLIDRHGYEPVFLAALAFSLLALWRGAAIGEPRCTSLSKGHLAQPPR